jgi:hypothetical protein
MESGDTSNPGNILQFVASFGGHGGVLNAAAPSSGETPIWKTVLPPAEGGKL